MGQDIIGEHVRYEAACPDCGEDMRCSGGQTLVGTQLNWDIETHCPACRSAVAVHGREDIPGDLRARMRAEHGASRLDLAEPHAHPAVVMKVLRRVYDLDLAQGTAILGRLQSRQHTGTMR